jgi:hypothetical protein
MFLFVSRHNKLVHVTFTTESLHFTVYKKEIGMFATFEQYFDATALLLGSVIVVTCGSLIYWCVLIGKRIYKEYTKHSRRRLEKRIARCYCTILDNGEWMSSHNIKKHAERNTGEHIDDDMHERILFLLTEQHLVKQRKNGRGATEEYRLIC